MSSCLLHAGGICAAADNKVQCFSLDPVKGLLAVHATLEVKQQGIADICIRQDQRLVATAGWDGKVRVFHHKKFKPLAILQVCLESHSEFQSLSLLAFLGQFCLNPVQKIWCHTWLYDIVDVSHSVSFHSLTCQSNICSNFVHGCSSLVFPAVVQYHRKGLTALRFHPQDQRLISASRDGTIAIWSVFQSETW